MPKYFKNPFAISGDKSVVSDDAQPSNVVAYETGYTPEYELDQDTSPNALNVERVLQNQIFFDITESLKQWQEIGVMPFITAAQNGGSPFPYADRAVVFAGGGVYRSIVDNNTSSPLDAPFHDPVFPGAFGNNYLGDTNGNRKYPANVNVNWLPYSYFDNSVGSYNDTDPADPLSTSVLMSMSSQNGAISFSRKDGGVSAPGYSLQGFFNFFVLQVGGAGLNISSASQDDARLSSERISAFNSFQLPFKTDLADINSDSDLTAPVLDSDQFASSTRTIVMTSEGLAVKKQEDGTWVLASDYVTPLGGVFNKISTVESIGQVTTTSNVNSVAKTHVASAMLAGEYLLTLYFNWELNDTGMDAIFDIFIDNVLVNSNNIEPKDASSSYNYCFTGPVTFNANGTRNIQVRFRKETNNGDILRLEDFRSTLTRIGDA